MKVLKGKNIIFDCKNRRKLFPGAEAARMYILKMEAEKMGFRY